MYSKDVYDKTLMFIIFIVKVNVHLFSMRTANKDSLWISQ